MSELEELQQTLITLFHKNRIFLKKQFPHIFQKVELFEKQNIENYYIDFKQEGGYFELIDSNNQPIYNCNSFYDAQQRANTIESSQAIFSMLVTNIAKENFNQKDEICAHKYVQEFLSLSSNTSNSIKSEKFIFIGTLLGLHITDIHKKLKQKAYLIVEPHIEIFRLSLFLTDYKQLSQESKLFLCINESCYHSKPIYEFLSYEFSYNHHIKFELSSEQNIHLIEELENIITTNNPFVHAFSEDAISLTRGYNHLKTIHNGLLNYKGLKLFHAKPVLILGAGPSLEKYQSFIQKYHPLFILICASAALKRLEKIDVIPDIIVTIDKKSEGILEQFNVSKKIYKDSVVLFGPKTNPQVVEKIDSPYTFMIQENFSLFKSFATINCVSVGDFIYKFTLSNAAQEIYLLGIDAALSEGKTHDSLHTRNSIERTNFETSRLQVKGNFQSYVHTSLLYKEIIDSFALTLVKKQTKVFNLSDGAYLEHTKPLKCGIFDATTLKKINKTELKKQFLTMLNQHTHKEPNKQTQQENKKELELLKQLKPPYEDKQILKLFSKNPNSKTLNILHGYLKLINPYLNANNSTHANELKQKQLDEIIKTLRQLFEYYLK